VQAKVSTVTTLVNDGSSIGTQIIESTPSGAASSTISILNDGTVTIKGDVASVLTTLLQLIPGAGAGGSSVKLGDAARQTEVLGSLLVDGITNLDNGALTTDGNGNISKSGGKIGVASAGDIFDGSGFDTFVKARGSSNLVHLQMPGGTDIATFGSAISLEKNTAVTGTLSASSALSVTGTSSLDNAALTTDG
jgi:hypothetical protein